MITSAQLTALAQTLSLTSAPSTTQPGVVQIRITPDISTLSLQQTDPGQTITALLKFVRFADAGLSGLAAWFATITDTQLASNQATYGFSGATETPQPGQTITITGCTDPTYNITGTIVSLPDSTHFTVNIVHADIPLATGQTGFATADIISYLVGNLLGGQPMPAIQIPMPGPGLQGAQLPPASISTSGPITGPGGLTATITSPTVAAVPSLPSLPDDSGLTLAQRMHDLLKGVPGIVFHLEQQVTAAISAPIAISVSWSLNPGENGQPLTDPNGNPLTGVLANFLPRPDFYRAGTPQGFDQFVIGATVTLTAAGVSSGPVTLPNLTLSVPQISVAQMGALFTWRSYGTQSSSGDTSPDDDSTLLMIPSDSPVSDLPSIVAALSQLVSSLQGLATTFGGPLSGIALDPAIGGLTGVTTVAGNLVSAVSGIGSLITALNYTVFGHADFRPVTIARAASGGAGSLGGIVDNSVFYFDVEEAGLGHDRYHDHAKSALIVGPPGCGLELDYDNNFDGSQGKISMMTGPITTVMGALFVGVRDFHDVSGTTDPSGATATPSGSHSLYEHTHSMKFLP